MKKTIRLAALFLVSCLLQGFDSAYVGASTITDNNDGTVTDTATGLMWQQKAGEKDVYFNWYEATGTPNEEHNPAGATDVCGSLDLAGHTDWRTPDIEELKGLLTCTSSCSGYEKPYVNPALQINTSRYFWSSDAWGIAFYSGYYGDTVTGGYVRENKDGYVICTRQATQETKPGANGEAVAAPILTVTVSGLNVSLSWTSVEGATGYTLYYAPYPYSGPSSIGSADMGAATEFSIDLWEGASYYAAVTSRNANGESSYSNIELVTISAVTSGGPTPSDTLAYAKAMVPGAWAYAGYSCSKLPDPRIQANYFLCPAGGLRGAEDTYISGKKYAYVAKGKWSVTSTPNDDQYASIVLDYTTTISVGGVVDSGDGLLGSKAGYMLYDASQDRIAYYFNACWMVLNRLVDDGNIGVDDSYCQSSGSSSTNACQADYDCGRCWYCDKSGSQNVCRYGGEGPYGCYRGWSP